MYHKTNDLEILSLYITDYNRRFYLREISKISKIPLKTVQNILCSLEKKNILKSRIEGKNKYFFLNLDNILTKSYLLQTEIYKTNVFLEKYPLFKTFLKSTNTNTPLIIFGSFAKLESDKNSDLDLVIIPNKKNEIPFHLLPYKIHKVELSETSFKKALKEKEDLIEEIKKNHIILNNHSFYVNVMWGYYEK